MVISAMFNLSSANAFNLLTSKFLSFGKGLMTEADDRKMDSAEQDPIACMHRLILLYSLCK